MSFVDHPSFIFGSVALARLQQCKEFIKEEPDDGHEVYHRAYRGTDTEEIITLAFKKVGQAYTVTISRSAVTDVLDRREQWNDYIISFVCAPLWNSTGFFRLLSSPYMYQQQKPPVTNTTEASSDYPFVKGGR